MPRTIEPQNALYVRGCNAWRRRTFFRSSTTGWSDGVLIGIDQDEMAFAAGARTGNLALKHTTSHRAPTRQLRQSRRIAARGRNPGVDAFLFDLGVSSPSDFPSRGSSRKTPLDMRMDPGKQTVTAARAHKHLDAHRTHPDHPRLLRRKNGPVASPSLSSSLASTHRLRRVRSSSKSSRPPSRIGTPCGRPSGQEDVSGLAHRSELGARF